MVDIVFNIAEEKHVTDLARLDDICFAVPWSQDAFYHEIIENPIALYIVALDLETNDIVGYAGLWIIYDEGHITNVAVRPDYRKNGIGSNVVVNLMEKAREKGVSNFTLEVREGNIAAINMYEKLGFFKVGLRKAYYTDNNENAIIMWKNDK